MPLHVSVPDALIRRAREGDLEAFGQIMGAYDRAVRHYIFRFVGNESDAADLAQESFIKLYQALSSYDDQKRFLGIVPKSDLAVRIIQANTNLVPGFRADGGRRVTAYIDPEIMMRKFYGLKKDEAK